MTLIWAAVTAGTIVLIATALKVWIEPPAPPAPPMPRFLSLATTPDWKNR